MAAASTSLNSTTSGTFFSCPALGEAFSISNLRTSFARFKAKNGDTTNYKPLEKRNPFSFMKIHLEVLIPELEREEEAEYAEMKEEEENEWGEGFIIEEESLVEETLLESCLFATNQCLEPKDEESDHEEQEENEWEEEFIIEEESLVEETLLESCLFATNQSLESKDEESDHEEQWITEEREVHYTIIREENFDGTVTFKMANDVGTVSILDPTAYCNIKKW